MGDTSLLQIRKLSHRFSNGFLGLNNVSMDIEHNDFMVLAGPNGSGKTVLMRHFNGLALPTSGDVLFEKVPVLADLRRARRSIGLVFQDADAQIVGQTVGRDTAFGPENLRMDRNEISKRVEESLEATGLAGFNDRRPHTLSGGEKRRLAVAGVLAMRPRILVLDEPFTGLDWDGSARLIEILTNLHADGTAILVITHDLEKILAHANRLVLMNLGRIHADSHPLDSIDKVEDLGIRRPRCEISEMTWKYR